MRIFAFALACATLVHATMASAQEQPAQIIIEGDVLRLTDMVAIPAGHTSLSQRIIARLPEGSRRMRIDARALSDLVRRQAPGLMLVPRFPGGVEVTSEGEHLASDLEDRCSVLLTALDSGDYIDASMLKRVACAGDRPVEQSLHYDRTARALAARADLPAGAYLGRIAVSGTPVMAKGSALRLLVRSGPVVVEREVTALQPARDGERLFVRTKEGAVLPAVLRQEAP